MSAPGTPGRGTARSTLQRKRQQEQRGKIREALMRPHPYRARALGALRQDLPHLFEALLGVLDGPQAHELMDVSRRR